MVYLLLLVALAVGRARLTREEERAADSANS